jgi:hypothetical protein
MAKEPAGNASTGPAWLVYITNLPTEDPAARMRILRTLDSLGCSAIRDGVFLLPDTPANRLGLSRLTDHVVRISGTAHLLSATSLDEAQANHFRGLFDRSHKYLELVKTVESLKAAHGISDPVSIARVINKQRREFDAISALDFFPSDARDRAVRALADAEVAVRGLMFPDAQKSGDPAKTAGKQYFRCQWATRKPLWADRLASAWLIRRFIDPEATLAWLDKNQTCPANAVGFAFDGAEFASADGKVTFEQMLANFNLEGNTGLARIGRLIHALDEHGAKVPEAAGVEILLQGAMRRASGEDELLAETEKTFDLLYEAYFEAHFKSPGKT